MVKCYSKNYPRPQFVREQWKNLNGLWNFQFDDSNLGEIQSWYRSFPDSRMIQVPFAYTTKKSGIHLAERHDILWYHREFMVDNRFRNNHRILLHFEGSDYQTRIWINGIYIGEHQGGYSRFSFDITDAVQSGTNQITVQVKDSQNTEQPRGKQRWTDQSFTCYYGETTGIWKTVWIESVSASHLNSIKMTPDLSNHSIHLDYEISNFIPDKDMILEAEISLENHPITVVSTAVHTSIGTLSADVFRQSDNGLEWGIREWSPKDPALYDIIFRLKQNGKIIDEVFSYFAMREIKIEGSSILLNGRPLYQRLVLDQGYWKESHLTPPNEDSIIKDIDAILSLGYNGARKHQKIEDERFLFWCDIKGLLIWSEMAASYRFTDRSIEHFTSEWMDIIRQNYNHPCIITWVPFNESWGIPQIHSSSCQKHFTEAIYHLTKTFDPYRPVIVNDGWEHTVSDILTLHDYIESSDFIRRKYIENGVDILQKNRSHNGEFLPFADGYSYHGQPVIFSEFGGIAFDNDESGWGYGSKAASEEDFLQRFNSIVTAIKDIPWMCGYCYTQLTDVQQEINGLLTEERIPKIDPDRIKIINERIEGAMINYVRTP